MARTLRSVFAAAAAAAEASIDGLLLIKVSSLDWVRQYP